VVGYPSSSAPAVHGWEAMLQMDAKGMAVHHSFKTLMPDGLSVPHLAGSLETFGQSHRVVANTLGARAKNSTLVCAEFLRFVKSRVGQHLRRILDREGLGSWDVFDTHFIFSIPVVRNDEIGVLSAKTLARHKYADALFRAAVMADLHAPHRNHRVVAFIEEPKATAVFALFDDNGCDAFKV
jgi:hypothetical protein